MTMVLFGIVPAVVALGVIVVSIRSMVRAFSLVQLTVGIPAILVAAWSLFVLERIFLDNAWPTFLPHILIPLTVPLAAFQWRLARRTDSDIDERVLFVVGLGLLAISATPLVLMAREIAMSNAAVARYSTEHIQSGEPGMAGGALRAEIGGHVVALEDDQPLDTNGDVRVHGLVRILIDGRDYSTKSTAEIRLNSRDANRYWGYVYLMKLVDRRERAHRVAVAQNLGNGRFRTLTVSANGTVVEDQFDYAQRCDPPVRAILIDYVVGHSAGLCSTEQDGWAAVFYPVVYPWVFCALGFGCVIDAIVGRHRRLRRLAPSKNEQKRAKNE